MVFVLLVRIFRILLLIILSFLISLLFGVLRIILPFIGLLSYIFCFLIFSSFLSRCFYLGSIRKAMESGELVVEVLCYSLLVLLQLMGVVVVVTLVLVTFTGHKSNKQINQKHLHVR